jgi:hypothetical protein
MTLGVTLPGRRAEDIGWVARQWGDRNCFTHWIRPICSACIQSSDFSGRSERPKIPAFGRKSLQRRRDGWPPSFGIEAVDWGSDPLRGPAFPGSVINKPLRLVRTMYLPNDQFDFAFVRLKRGDAKKPINGSSTVPSAICSRRWGMDRAMGKVSIRAQWLMVAAGVLLSLVVAIFIAWFIGWPRIRRLWPRRVVGPG